MEHFDTVNACVCYNPSKMHTQWVLWNETTYLLHFEDQLIQHHATFVVLCLLNDDWNVSYAICWRQLPSGLGIFLLNKSECTSLNLALLSLSHVDLKRQSPKKTLNIWFTKRPISPFLRVKLLDSKTWDVFGRHQKRCTSRWCTARAVVCRRTAVQVLWNRGSGDWKLAAAFTGLIVFDIFDIVEPYYIRQLHVSCRIL